MTLTAANTALLTWSAPVVIEWPAPITDAQLRAMVDAEIEADIAAAVAASEIDAPEDFDPTAVRIVRHRQSVTQCEVSVFYGDTLIARFGDKIALRDGLYDGYPDGVWIEAAQRWHRGELRGL